MPSFLLHARRQSLVLLTLLLTTLLAGCGQAPDDDALTQALNQELKRAHLDQLFTVDSIDSVKSYRHDDDHYSMAVHYTLLAKRDLSDYEKEVEKDTGGDALDRYAMIMTLAAVRNQFGDFTKGDILEQERRLSLERNDSGWFIPPPDR